MPQKYNLARHAHTQEIGMPAPHGWCENHYTAQLTQNHGSTTYLDTIWRDVEDGIVDRSVPIGVLCCGNHLGRGEEDVDVGVSITHHGPVEGGKPLIVLRRLNHKQIQT